ncbi:MULTISPECIES: hydrogenase maturation nickel metallochaperone HypA [unclassified Flavobacterium]|jgi:hydrogenase nickel incorporation protein HypA/HybF|uniref:hydrogenase maturation nickel metallochaperone HypA n=1 Tax=unclassified Flavobacterium TaxID=196869 RepID=UPI0025C39EF2|nr:MULTISPECIES: hydrogenase maturation nickel metallochaperone HypA [unclassified Flavobacterium]
MHELSIVTSIIKTAEKEVENGGGVKVLEIYLEIGKLSGVEIQSLNFVWELSANGTVLQDSKVIITEPEGRAKCAECDMEYRLGKIYDSCPKCNSPFKNIISGKELKIKKLIIN